MEFNTFVRKPFVVEAIQVTAKNIAEIAELTGELVKLDDGSYVIRVDPNKVPYIANVSPGFWLTRMGDNMRFYASRIFAQQFVRSTPDINESVKFINAVQAATRAG